MNLKYQRKKGRLTVLLSFFIIAITVVFFTDHTCGEQSSKGLVTYVTGSVKKKSTTVQNWEKAKKNTPVSSGDMVRTYRESQAELELMEMDIIRMAPQTTLDVVLLYEETREKRREVKVHLAKGDIWAKVKKKGSKSKFKITTPLTVAAITGTTLRLSYDADSTTQLKVYNGEVNISNTAATSQLKPKMIEPYQVSGPHEIAGPHEVGVEQWLYIVKSMQQITIDSKGRILTKGEFSINDIDEKSNWVKWNKERDRSTVKE